MDMTEGRLCHADAHHPARAGLGRAGRPHPGWSDRSVLDLPTRETSRPHSTALRRWDYYQISDENMCLELTFGHASYAGQVGAMLFNFRPGRYRAPDKLLALPFGRLHLPESAQADSDLVYDKGGLYMRFRVEGGRRQLTCRGDGFEAEIHLTPTTDKSLVINVPLRRVAHGFLL